MSYTPYGYQPSQGQSGTQRGSSYPASNQANHIPTNNGHMYQDSNGNWVFYSMDSSDSQNICHQQPYASGYTAADSMGLLQQNQHQQYTGYAADQSIPLDASHQYYSQSYNQGHPVDPPQAVAFPISTTRTRCTWGGRCGIELDDTSAAGINRHLKEYHFNTRDNPWVNSQRGRCLWDPNCRSHDPIKYENMGKHIAEVHLKALRQICPDCGGSFARGDTLARHKREIACKRA